MKSTDFIIESSSLKKTDLAMGMTLYQNEDIMLAGGIRSGNSDSSHTRLKYTIYDLRNVTPEEFSQDQEQHNMGVVELFVLDGSGIVDGLVNINLSPKSRGNGIGRIVIQSLKSTFKSLKIFDIKQKAIPFWRKMGATFYTDSHFTNQPTKTTNVALSKMAKFGLYAII